MTSPLHRFLAVFSIVLLVTFVTLLPFCNLMFSCGCTFTGPAHCNVHHATGPRCPWCAHGNGVFAAAYGLTVIGVAASVVFALQHRRTRRSLVAAILAGLVGYVLSGSVVGLGTALYFRYPTWYGLHLSAATAQAQGDQQH